MKYVVYTIECLTPNHMYVGYTFNLNHRIKQHTNGKGAVFTRKHGVKCVIGLEYAESKEEAKLLESRKTAELRHKHPDNVVCGAAGYKPPLNDLANLQTRS